MPMERNSARPLAVTRTIFAVKSACAADVAANRAHARLPEDLRLALDGLRRVDEQVVAHLERGLIEGSAQRLRPARRKHGHFGIVDENIARLFAFRRLGRQAAVAFARICIARAVQIERASQLLPGHSSAVRHSLRPREK